jgi:hypothetical protein
MRMTTFDRQAQRPAVATELGSFFNFERSRSGKRNLEIQQHRRWSAAHHKHAIGQVYGFAYAVGYEDYGLAIAFEQLGQDDIHLVACDGVECTEWLVHEQNLRVVHECPADGHPLAHAPRQFVRALVIKSAKTHALQKLARAIDVFAASQLQDVHWKHNVV